MSNAAAAVTRTRVIVGIGVIALAAMIVGKPFHVPAGPIAQSLFPAMAAALSAVCLVLIYRTVRIVNWVQLALGAIAAQLFYEFYTRHYVPYGVAILVGLAAGVLVAAVIGIISATLFFKHPRLVMTVVTILMVGFIQSISQQIDQAIHVNDVVRTTPEVIGPYPSASIDIGVIPFRFAHLVGFLMMLLVAVGLVVFFKRTRVGTAIRASAENSDRASLLGINVKLLQMGIWVLVGFVSSVSAIAVQPVSQYTNEWTNQVELLLPLTAAVVARMSSMPIAFFTALGMVVFRQAMIYATGISSELDLMMFVVLMGSLLIQRKRLSQTSRVDDSTSWKAVKETRPTPREMLKLPSIRRARWAIMAITFLVVLAIPWITSSSTTNNLQAVWGFSMVALSLVVLTGWSGQISLGQFAFVTVGAFVAGRLILSVEMPFLLALPIAGVAGALFAVIVGLPALRIKGLFLGVSTFAIAVVMPLLIFEDNYLGKWAPTQDVPKPKFLTLLDFEDPRSMYYLSLLMFVLVLLSVQALRKSRAGRVLIALRDNEAGVQSFGINVVKTRLTAFAISGFIASFAGALLVVQQGGMERSAYGAGVSIQAFILVVIGGVSSPMGAVLGAAYATGSALLFPGLAALLQGALGLVVLMAIPGGLTQIFYGVRDAVLRVVAMRRNIVVPSLFADYSPEAWEKRLAPLAPAVQSQGLATLKPDQRYALKSRIFGEASV